MWQVTQDAWAPLYTRAPPSCGSCPPPIAALYTYYASPALSSKMDFREHEISSIGDHGSLENDLVICNPDLLWLGQQF